MRLHPALFMSAVWIACVVIYLILPFQLVSRPLTWQGSLVLGLFVFSFVLGTLLVSQKNDRHKSQPVIIDATVAELLLKSASLLATFMLCVDSINKNIFDLEGAYELRSAAADNLLKGFESNSSIYFKIAFLCYPASYVWIATHIIFTQKIGAMRMAVFGFLPIALASLVMGGRAPIFFCIMVTWLSFRERNKLSARDEYKIQTVTDSRAIIWRIAFATIVFAAFYLFAKIFMVRAETAGGAAGMFDVAEQTWGVGFRGYGSEFIFSFLGENGAYLFFVFLWYLVQGFVISNYLFTDYDGPLQYGVYGIDLISAIVRRWDPQFLTNGFDALLNVGTYGFLPSAWGSLYVDFSYFGILAALLWGCFAGLVHKRIVIDGRTDWLMIRPFMALGILFSVINTPLGFTNGFVTHFWLLVAFMMLKRSSMPEAKSASHSIKTTD